MAMIQNDWLDVLKPEFSKLYRENIAGRWFILRQTIFLMRSILPL